MFRKISFVFLCRLSIDIVPELFVNCINYTKIFIDAKATDSFDKVLQEKCFDVLEGLHIEVINR